jgi:hypothetical protein
VKGRDPRYGSTTVNGSPHVQATDDDDEETWTIKAILRLDIVRKALVCYAALALTAVMHDAAWTLW